MALHFSLRESYTTYDMQKKIWSQNTTLLHDALFVEEGVFSWKDPHQIAVSLKHSAEENEWQEGTRRQSALSMLNFYINRAGKNLNLKQKRILISAKAELKSMFG